MASYDIAASFAERIERELRRLDGWPATPPPESAWQSREAFFADTMTFFQWLQFVLLPRIRQIVTEQGHFPSQSMVGTYAIRELDGFDEASDLVSLLCDFDAFIEGDGSASLPLPQPQKTTPIPSRTPAESPLEVANRYWRTRDSQLLHTHPQSAAGYDTSLAERVFATASALIEIPGEPEKIAEGWLMRTVVQADRGPWLILTALSLDGSEWRIDLPLSIARTTMMFLRQHHIWPPYTDADDARGHAMRFWHHAANRNDRLARELLLLPADEVPHFGEGYVDEFFWYLTHEETEHAATVRVLMNTRDTSRVWFTRMVKQEGSWFVDLPATLDARE